MSYRVVEEFERAVADYCGAPHAVATNSCSTALQIALAGYPKRKVQVPRCTYASAALAVLHAGHTIEWVDSDWYGSYEFAPLPVVDSARRFTSGMFYDGVLMCVSFQSSKILGIEQGGMILHDGSQQLDDWLRRMRFDGRLNAEEKLPQIRGIHAYLNPSTAALGLQRLACLPRDNPDQAGAADFPDISALPCFR